MFHDLSDGKQPDDHLEESKNGGGIFESLGGKDHPQGAYGLSDDPCEKDQQWKNNPTPPH
ncbi:MAG: hypothetical protein R6X13_12400 [bacterium]